MFCHFCFSLLFSVSNSWLYFLYVGFLLKQVPLNLWQRWLQTAPILYFSILVTPVRAFPLVLNKCSEWLALAQRGSCSQVWVSYETACSFARKRIFRKFSMPCNLGLGVGDRHQVISSLQIHGDTRYVIDPICILIKGLGTGNQPPWLFKGFP